MFKTFSHLLFCSILLNCHCFADRYIVPAKYEDQEEIFIQGASITVSQKINSMSLYQTCKKIKHHKANFYFTFFNQTDHPLNLMFSNLRVTDQWGRPLRVLHKNELISNKKSQRDWNNFSSSLTAFNDSLEAQKAGRVDYQSSTDSSVHSHFNTQGSKGWNSGTANSYTSTTTQGVVHCEALRQQALKQAENDAALRSELINNTYSEWKYGLSNYYFDTTTVFPGTTYGANLQIEIPKNIEKSLEFIIFTFAVDGEDHSFCFYCPAR